MATQSYIFGKGTPWTYEELQRKRQIADALASQIGSPSNVGEGLTAIGKALGARGINKRADKRDAELKGEFENTWAGLFGGGMGGGMGGMPAAQPAIAPSRSAGPNQGIADDTMAELVKTGLVQRGLPQHVADGFVMNFKDESGLDPNINEKAPMVPGSRGGFGLAQWTGPRRVALEQYASSRGKPVGDMNTQLDFLMTELQGPEASAAKSILGAQDANSAAVAVARDFLRPAQANLDRRVAEYGGGAQQINPMDIGTLAELAGSPYATPGQKAVVQALIQQQMQAADPMRQMEMERARLELDALRNPKPDPVRLDTFTGPDGTVYRFNPITGAAEPMTGAKPVEQKQTDDMREYEFAKSQGYQGSFTDFQTQMRKAGASSVTVNGDTGPQVGTIPQGYQLTQDPATGALRMEAITGGPEDKSANAAAKTSQNATASDTVTTAAARARSAAGQRDFGSLGTTIMGRLNPLSDSAEVVRNVNVLKSQASIGNLQAMRDSSPTGGALGNVTEKELQILQDKSGALDPNSPTFERDLDDYERTLLRTIHGKDDGDRVFEATRGGSTPDADGWMTVNGVRIREKR